MLHNVGRFVTEKYKKYVTTTLQSFSSILAKDDFSEIEFGQDWCWAKSKKSLIKNLKGRWNKKCFEFAYH